MASQQQVRTAQLMCVCVFLSAQIGVAGIQSTVGPEVGPNNAAFVTSIELPVPAFHGLEPELELRYDSTRRNGFVGIGWALVGGSTIQRASPGRGMPRYADALDTFYLDGERLVACTTCGGAGGNHTTQVRRFMRVERSGNTWLITRGDGTRLTYSPTFTTAQGTFRWELTQVRDTNGNTVTYSYAADGALDAYLDRITYNGTEIQLVREARTDALTFQIGDAQRLGQTRFRLKSVVVRVGGALRAAWRLTYTNTAVTLQSQLTQVQRFGTDATVAANGDISGGTPYPPTVLGYASSAAATPFSAAITSNIASLPSGTQFDYGFLIGPGPMADFNGDGRADVSFIRGEDGQAIHVCLSLGDGKFGPAKKTVPPTGLWVVPAGWHAGDINNDGKADLYGSSLGETGWVVIVFLSKGDGTFQPPMTSVARRGEDLRGYRSVAGNADNNASTDLFAYKATSTGYRVLRTLASSTGTFAAATVFANEAGDFNGRWLQIGDFMGRGLASGPVLRSGAGYTGVEADLNGDGADEAIAVIAGADGWRASIAWPKGVNASADLVTGAAQVLELHGANYTGWVPGSGDFNGDGRADYVITRSATGAARVMLSRGDSVSGIYGLASPPDANTRPLLGDVNGDGRTDVVWLAPNAAKTGLTIRSYLSQFGYDGRLVSVKSPEGAITTVQYGYSSSYPNTYLPNGLVVPVVTKLSTNHGGGAAGAVTFSYAGGLWSDAERRFLGFRTVSAVIDAVGTKRITDYLMTVAGQGSPTRVRLTNSAGTAYRVTELEYEQDAAVPAYALLSRRVDSECNLTTTCRKRERRYVWDTVYGELIHERDYGDVAVTGDETISTNHRNPNTTAFIGALPSARATRAGLDGSGTLLSYTEYRYDGAASHTTPPAKGNLTMKREWNGEQTRVTEYRYDVSGNVISETNALGHERTTQYDTEHRLYPTRECNELGHCTSHTWNAALGVITRTVDPNGNATTFTYDAHGRPRRTSLSNGEFVERVYAFTGDPTKQYIETRTSDGSADGVWEREYKDGLGRTYRVEREGGFNRNTVYSPDVPGRVIQVSLWYQAGTTPKYERFSYEPQGRVSQVNHADGSKKIITYTVACATSRDEVDQVRESCVDVHGRETIRREKLGATSLTSRLEYDLLGRLTKVTDAAGNVSTESYNPLGDKVRSCDPDLGCWTYEYDLLGNPIRQTDARGQVVTSTYDALGRRTGRTGGDVWRYDEAGHGDSKGRLTSHSFGGGRDDFHYDAAGRVARATHCRGSVCDIIDTTYDVAGRLASVVYPDETVRYQYDAAGRLSAVAGYASGLQYDAAGRLTRTTLANGLVETFTYDANRGWHTSSTLAKGTTQLHRTVATYGINGRVASWAVTSGGATKSLALTYDTLDRLTGVTGAQTQTFTYDSIGNLLSNSRVGAYVYGDPKHRHAVTKAGASTYTYDANGNMLSGAGRTLRWDEHNRLASLDVGGQTSSFTYDGQGQRVRAVQGSVTTTFMGRYLERSGSTVTKYIWAGGRRLASRVGSQGAIFYHQDALGSTRALTNSAGAVVRLYDYQPFGALESTSGSQETTVRYAGYRADTSGLNYVEARYYDPVLGRFISADTIVPSGGPQQLNRYAYANNSPFTYSDPTGHFSFRDTWSSISSAISSAFSGAFSGSRGSSSSGGSYLSRPGRSSFSGGSSRALTHSIRPMPRTPQTCPSCYSGSSSRPSTTSAWSTQQQAAWERGSRQHLSKIDDRPITGLFVFGWSVTMGFSTGLKRPSDPASPSYVGGVAVRAGGDDFANPSLEGLDGVTSFRPTGVGFLGSYVNQDNWNFGYGVGSGVLGKIPGSGPPKASGYVGAWGGVKDRVPAVGVSAGVMGKLGTAFNGNASVSAHFTCAGCGPAW